VRAARPAATAPVDPAACRIVRLSDIGWTDVTATTALFGALIRHLGYQPEITVLSLFESGRIVQTGTGRDIVERPADDYVAEFVRHVNPRTAIKGAVVAPTAP
jgi:hypothetical protein